MSRLIKVKLALVDGDHLLATRKVDDASGQWLRKINEISSFSSTAQLNRTFSRGGFTLKIDDTDGALQAMMQSETNRKIMDRAVTVYVYGNDGVTLQDTIAATIADWGRPEDGVFELSCVQDFGGKLQALSADKVITAADWPNAPASSLGQPVPFPSGVIYHMKPDGVTGGAFQALLIDARPNTKYLLTWSDPADPARILSIEGVWSQHILVDPIYYSLVKDANGWEYITLDSGFKDCSYVLLNLTAQGSVASANNPVDYLRENLTNAGITLVDDGDGGTDDFKTFCTTNSWGVIGSKQYESINEFLEVWCNNFDCFWRIDSAGSIHIKHIDWAAVTADAALSRRHFEEFNETAKKAGFANRIRAKLNYNAAESAWGQETLTDSTTGDILPATKAIEKEEEYAIASFGGAVTPMASKVRYYDHPEYMVAASMTYDHWTQLGLHVLSVVTIDHYKQLGASGKYLMLTANETPLDNVVDLTAVRLWGA